VNPNIQAENDNAEEKEKKNLVEMKKGKNQAKRRI